MKCKNCGIVLHCNGRYGDDRGYCPELGKVVMYERECVRPIKEGVRRCLRKTGARNPFSLEK